MDTRNSRATFYIALHHSLEHLDEGCDSSVHSLVHSFVRFARSLVLSFHLPSRGVLWLHKLDLVRLAVLPPAFLEDDLGCLADTTAQSVLLAFDPVFKGHLVCTCG